jgi:hypothetical protein
MIPWAPSPAEAALLETGEAIVYHHDGLHEVVRCDALPHDLDVYSRAQDRAELLKMAKEALRKSPNRAPKVSRKLLRGRLHPPGASLD